jgi:hypothetical protein
MVTTVEEAGNAFQTGPPRPVLSSGPTSRHQAVFQASFSHKGSLWPSEVLKRGVLPVEGSTFVNSSVFLVLHIGRDVFALLARPRKSITHAPIWFSRTFSILHLDDFHHQAWISALWYSGKLWIWCGVWLAPFGRKDRERIGKCRGEGKGLAKMNWLVSKR